MLALLSQKVQDTTFVSAYAWSLAATTTPNQRPLPEKLIGINITGRLMALLDLVYAMPNWQELWI